MGSHSYLVNLNTNIGELQELGLFDNIHFTKEQAAKIEYDADIGVSNYKILSEVGILALEKKNKDLAFALAKA